MTTDKRWIREKTQNPEMCKKCGGMCCKQCGCAYFPEDLGEKLSYENLLEFFEKKLIIIDCVRYEDGNAYKPLAEPIYYLRVPNVMEKGKLAENGSGKCSFLTEKGCKLSYDQRPSEGKYLVPFWSGCYLLYKTQEFIDVWTPYQDLLKSFM